MGKEKDGSSYVQRAPEPEKVKAAVRVASENVAAGTINDPEKHLRHGGSLWDIFLHRRHRNQAAPRQDPIRNNQTSATVNSTQDEGWSLSKLFSKSNSTGGYV